jgi:hypothetical protein
MMLQSLYTWRIAWNSLPISIFFFFLSFWNLFFFFYILGVLLYTSCILGLSSFALLMNLHYLLEKKSYTYQTKYDRVRKEPTIIAGVSYEMKGHIPYFSFVGKC